MVLCIISQIIEPKKEKRGEGREERERGLV